MGAKTEIFEIFSQLQVSEQKRVLDFARSLQSSAKETVRKTNLNVELSIMSDNEVKHLEDELRDYTELYPKNE